MAENLPDAPWASAAAGPKLPDAPWAAKPDIGRGTALATGISHGATANFADELAGTKAAGDVSGPVSTLTSGMPFGQLAPHILGLARLGYEQLTGQAGDAMTAYEKARNAERERHKTAKEQYPGTTMAGEMTGALAMPGGAMMQAGTLPARIGRGAAVGAGFGALSGAGEGEGLKDSATRAAIGAPVGAVVGAVAPPLVEGAVQGAKYLGRPIVNAVRGAINPESEAARRVVSAVDRDIQNDPSAVNRLAPREFADAVRDGVPASIMDIGGETTRALARSAANTSPEGRDILNRAVNDRFESQSERVTGWLNNTFGWNLNSFGRPDRGLTREALEMAATRANRPAYQRSYREGDQPLWSDELQRLVGSPDVVSAMKSAAERGKSRAIADGFGGFNSSVQVSPSGVVEFTKGKNGVPTYPNLQFWDYTKRELDAAAKIAARAGDDGHAGVLQNLAGKLRGELDTMVPSYQTARAGAARFFGAENAIDAGEKFLTSNVPLPEARRAFAKMSQPEQELFRQSYIQSLTQKIESAPDRRSVLNAVFNTPKAREQAEMVMGPARARQFEAMMRVEGVMDRARTAVQGNSTTARQLAELGLAGSGAGMMGVGTYSMDPKEIGIGAVMAALAGGGRHIDQNVARRVAGMLTSTDPAVLRQGVMAVTRNQNLFNGLRRADKVTLPGTQQGSGLVGIPSGVLPARGDEPQRQQQ